MAIGKSLKNVKAEDLGCKVISEAIHNSKLSKNDIDEVIMGQVLTGGSGQNPARQASIKSGIQKKNLLMLLIKFVDLEQDQSYLVFKVSNQETQK